MSAGLPRRRRPTRERNLALLSEAIELVDLAAASGSWPA